MIFEDIISHLVFFCKCFILSIILQSLLVLFCKYLPRKVRKNGVILKLFFNSTGHKGEISEELKSLLSYFLDPEQKPEGEKTDLVRKIDDIVDFANRDNNRRRGYMTYVQAQMDAMNRGREEGRAEGASLMAKLAMFLAREGKFDEISRAGIDEGFRKEKMKEYNIS